MVECTYCLDTGVLSPQHVLVRGEGVYVCAPLGQMVEGYIVIAPYKCVACLANMAATSFTELSRYQRFVQGFYEFAYGISSATFYEQGRAGGGHVSSDFPAHAHLCCMPLTLNLHALLAPRFQGRAVAGPEEILMHSAGRPYVYVQDQRDRRIYLPRSSEGQHELERLRLKSEIAQLVLTPERGDWRRYPGRSEQARVSVKFRSYSEGRTA